MTKRAKQFDLSFSGYEVFTEHLAQRTGNLPVPCFGRKMYIPAHNLSVEALKESIALSIYPDKRVINVTVYISEVYSKGKTVFKKRITLRNDYLKNFILKTNEQE